MRNSIDAVSDRDFALDYLYATAMLFQHLSRIGEEIVIWSTSEFGFVELPETAATGSSMMPQKLNPDVAELVRGKAGTAIGRLAYAYQQEGRTVMAVKGRIETAGGIPELAVVHWKKQNSAFPGDEPDYYAEITEDFIHYPWQRIDDSDYRVLAHPVMPLS